MVGFLLFLVALGAVLSVAGLARNVVLERRIRELGGESPGDGGGVADLWLDIATALQGMADDIPEAVRLAKLAALHAQRSGYLTAAEFEAITGVLDRLIALFPVNGPRAGYASADLIIAEQGPISDYEAQRLAAREARVKRIASLNAQIGENEDVKAAREALDPQIVRGLGRKPGYANGTSGRVPAPDSRGAPQRHGRPAAPGGGSVQATH